MPHLQAPVGPQPLASPPSVVPASQTAHTDALSLAVANDASFAAALARLDGSEAKPAAIPAAIQALPTSDSQPVAISVITAGNAAKAAGIVTASQPEARSHHPSGHVQKDPTSPPDPSDSTPTTALLPPSPILPAVLPTIPTGPAIVASPQAAPSGNGSISETPALAPPPHAQAPPPTPAGSLADGSGTPQPALHVPAAADRPSPAIQPAATASPAAFASTMAMVEPTIPAAAAAASPSTTSAPASTASAPISDQIAPVLLRIATAGGSHQISLHLTPDTLGRVSIEIDQPKGGPVSVTLSAERPETLALLKRDETQLAQTLDRAGVPAENRVVSFHLAPAPATQSNQDSTSQNGPGQGNPAQSGFGQASFGANGGGSNDTRRPPTPHAAYSPSPDPDAEWNASTLSAACATAPRPSLNATALNITA